MDERPADRLLTGWMIVTVIRISEFDQRRRHPQVTLRES